jgi:hypothetical protein
MKFKSLLLVLALTLGSGLVASAQSGWSWRDDNRNGNWRDNDRRNDRDWDRSNQKAYRDGYNDGQKAARHRGNSGKYNNHYRDRDDRQAYDAGYRRGYNSGNGQWGNGDWRDRDGDRDDDWRNDRDRNGDWRNDRNNQGRSDHPFGDVLGRRNGNYGNGRNIGYQDGYLAGQKDRTTGHSFRPQENKGYKDADKGYSSSLGSKDQYKQVYRDGFMQGYQRGYYGR